MLNDLTIIGFLLGVALVAAYMELDLQKQEEDLKEENQLSRLEEWRKKNQKDP